MGTFGGAGEDALSPLIHLAFPLTAGSTLPQQSLSTRDTFDQPTVEELLKDEIRASQGWQIAHQAGYDGLIPGIPLVPNILYQLIDKMFDATPLGDFFSMEDIQEFLNNPSFMTFLDAVIPDLHASKITDGLFPIDMIEDLGDMLLEFLTEFSPLNALNLFNLVPDHLIGHVAVSTIGDFISNLINNPLFEHLESIDSTAYSWDATQFHTLPGGSAKVVADGSGAKDLLSNMVRVSEGQPLHLSGWVKWSGLTGTGTPIQLGLTNYLNGTAVSQPNIATHNVVPASTDWLQLQGDYTVPANVNGVRLRLTVAAAATAGTIWWDDTHLSKRGLLPQPLILGSVGATLLDDLQEARDDILTNASAILDRVLHSEYVNLLEALDPTGTLEAIEDRLDSFLDHFSPLNASNINAGNVALGFLEDVRTTLNTIYTRLFNHSTPGSDQHTLASNALAHVSDTLAGLTSQVTKLTNQLSTGAYANDDFERTASSLGANWDVAYPDGTGGTVRCDGHNAYFSKSGTADRIYVCRYTPLTTLTDDQIISTTLNSKAENPLLSGLTGNPAYNDVLGRMGTGDMATAANRNYIRFRIGDGNAWLYRVIGGAQSEISHDTYSGADPGPGSALTLVCGKDGDHRYLEARHNGNSVTGATDTGHMMGGAFRKCGFGGYARNWPVFLTQSAPGAVRMWTGGDQ